MLAPAGGWEAFKAAVENGADAVYLGGKSFSARAGAANFDLEELARAVIYAHQRQVRIYVTVNILVADREWSELRDYVYELYQMGVDGLILQDIGVARMLRALLPELEIHASTQMTVNNSWGAKALEEMGFGRVVLARETSLREMAVIAQKTPLEIEVFVHGALCICYSGQCLMSSFIGGRSGNRGTCAQPCRMAYQLVDSRKEDVLNGGGVGDHLLSPKDLNLVEHLDELQDAGVNSLKIEGRMKRPEYVATVTRIYRKALLQAQAAPALSARDHYELAQIFNRDFTEGYLYEHPGGELMSYARPNNRGTRLGRIVQVDRDKIRLKLENGLHVGDGIEVWTKRGRDGTTVEQIWRSGGGLTEEALPGETVQILFPAPVGAGDRVFKTNDALLLEKARLSFQAGREIRKRPLQMRLSGKVGERLTLEGECEGKTVAVRSETEGRQALKRPLTAEYAKEHLSRLGNTPFSLGGFVFAVQGEIMLPVRELNEMRRMLIEKMLAESAFHPRVDRQAYEHRVKVWTKERQEGRAGRKINKIGAGGEVQAPRLTVAVSNLPGLKAALQGGAERIILDGEHWRSKKGFSPRELAEGLAVCANRKKAAVWRLPRILNEGQSEALFAQLQKLSGAEGRPAVMVSNLGELAMLQALDKEWPFEVDYTLNVFNQESLEYFLSLGAQKVTLSPELNHEQLEQLAGWPRTEVLVFGDLEMMVSEYCPMGATLGEKKGRYCTRPCTGQPYFLRDRLNYAFPIETDLECRMHLYNVKNLNLYQETDQLAAMGIESLRLQMIRAVPEQIVRTVAVFSETIADRPKGPSGKKKAEEKEKTVAQDEKMGRLEALFPDGFTKGHYFRGILN